MKKSQQEKEPDTTEIQKSNEHKEFQIVDISKSLPSLDDASVAPLDLVSEYWSPETTGESKRLFFVKIDIRPVKDVNSDEMIPLECAFFLEQKEDGIVINISNGSKRLVGALQASNVKKGMPFLITYMGKKQNVSNSFKSDNWSIKPILIQI